MEPTGQLLGTPSVLIQTSPMINAFEGEPCGIWATSPFTVGQEIYQTGSLTDWFWILIMNDEAGTYEDGGVICREDSVLDTDTIYIAELNEYEAGTDYTTTVKRIGTLGVAGEIDWGVSDESGVTTYTQEDLEAMTKQQILDLATELGYTMTTTMSNTKAEIIADFLVQQG